MKEKLPQKIATKPKPGLNFFLHIFLLGNRLAKGNCVRSQLKFILILFWYRYFYFSSCTEWFISYFEAKMKSIFEIDTLLIHLFTVWSIHTICQRVRRLLDCFCLHTKVTNKKWAFTASVCLASWEWITKRQESNSDFFICVTVMGLPEKILNFCLLLFNIEMQPQRP